MSSVKNLTHQKGSTNLMIVMCEITPKPGCDPHKSSYAHMFSGILTLQWVQFLVYYFL